MKKHSPCSILKKHYPCSINNTTYKINNLLFEALSLKLINKLFIEADKKEKAEIKKYVRNLTLGVEKLTASTIENLVIKELIDKDIKEKLNNSNI